MTDLECHLKQRIAVSGPMTVADYMSECLMHPEHGYYSTRDPFGVGGDFTTAPEISQMFGEFVGLSLAQSWIDQGAPGAFVLAELGPGRGTLMADILRAAASVPGFVEAAQVALVETSPALRTQQRDRLGDDVIWVDMIDQLPGGPLFLVANEFFDALPIRQFVRDAEAWRERVVTVTDGALGFGLSQPVRLGALEGRFFDTAPGGLVEICPAANPIMSYLGTRILAEGGAALIIDYGDVRSGGDTLQAIHRHEYSGVFDNPGNADLTAHVDFGALAEATPAHCYGPVTQGIWLERLGITARARKLARQLEGHAFESHIAAHRRLTHPEEMGTLFKTLGVLPFDAPPPPGFTQ
ncbi:class I SAM-dependent methyltransferase [Actibacterium sp. 188UL27-1]|uniref:class I SAM-dependent methyltransferase n=1 Tax=Actibacterium sp. 188UL27-1 TaxID=2786961 RepID=UPI00195E0AB3|nr:SAM-dependent methyltransferase [Actibacterium sp. 188UL27-1]MBM7066519.1 SAM-dependent methyltransferase [Actibacterium sp. 188UL27-1]